MSPLSLAAWIAAFFLSATLFSHTVALRQMLLIVGLVLVIAAVVRERRSLQVVPPIWLPFALWAAWAALSFLWTGDLQITDKEFRNEVLYASLALWMCFVAAQARNAPRIILPVVGAASALLCAIALYSFPQGVEIYARGYHGGPGNHSSALLALMPCLVMTGWWLRHAGYPLRVLGTVGALAVLYLFAAYTTQNRTVWLGFTAELLVIGALLALHHRAAITPRVKAAGAALAIAILAGGTLMTLHIQAEREKVYATPTLAKDPRFALWPEVFDHIRERPLTGYGFGRGQLSKPLREETRDTMLWHAHNLFLDTLLQTGVPGLLLLLLLLGATVREGWRLAREKDPAAVACGVALIALVVGMLVRNMTDVLWVRQNSLFYWGAAGVLLGWGTQRRALPAR